MVSDPLRFAASRFAVMRTLTLPLPAPVCPNEIVIQVTLLRAVQMQPGVELT
jgi:hypothetical protein